MKKVLVVDDSLTMRKVIMKTLRAAGFEACEFVEASDGVTGLEALAKEEVDLILTDLNMPNMNGVEFVRRVRDQKLMENRAVGDKCVIKQVNNTVPIVMITTEGGLDKVQEAIAAGASDYVRKPFTVEDFKAKFGPFLG